VESLTLRLSTEEPASKVIGIEKEKKYIKIAEKRVVEG
jgi:hypothetical protein